MAIPQGVSHAALAPSILRLQQFMQMHHDIFHFGIIDRLLSGGAPCFFGGGIIGEHSHNVELVEICKIECLGVFHPAPEHHMQFRFSQILAP
jgi:hypothetical protein